MSGLIIPGGDRREIHVRFRGTPEHSLRFRLGRGEFTPDVIVETTREIVARPLSQTPRASHDDGIIWLPLAIDVSDIPSGELVFDVERFSRHARTIAETGARRVELTSQDVHDWGLLEHPGSLRRDDDQKMR